MDSLPLELLSHICSFVSPNSNDLATLARLSHSWSFLAIPLLYQHISTTGPLHTLATNPQRAQAVRSFAVSHHHLLLSTALANMSHLQELDFFIDAPHFLSSSSSFPFLHRLATSIPWSTSLFHFLRNCPSISQLYLDSPHPPSLLPLPSIPPDFLPSLSHFTGPPSIALLLVPHRPVQHIDLTSSPHSQALTPDLALSLSLSSAPILALAASTSSTPRAQDQNLVTVLSVLAASMPHLRHLRVVTNTFADAATFGATRLFTNSYFDTITDALASLPDLQSCEIWGFHWVSSKKSHFLSASTTTWHSPTFANPTTTNTTNFLDDIYQDLIFPY